MSVQLNILCLISISRQYPQNCIEFDNDAWALFNFHSKYSKTKTISRPNCLVQTKFNMSTICLDNHWLFGRWSVARFSVSWLSWAHESIRTYCSWSLSEILWRYTICCTASHTEYPDCSVASFLVQWTQAHWNAAKQQCGEWRAWRSVLFEHKVVVRDTANCQQ